MVVMPIDIGKQAAGVFTQRVIQHQRRLGFWPALILGLLQHVTDSALVDLRFHPGRLGHEAREVGFVGTLQDTAGNIGQAFVRQDHQAGQVVLKMLKLAAIRKQIAEGVRMGCHEWCGRNKR